MARRQTRTFHYTRAAQDAILTAFGTNPAAAIFATKKVHLMTGDTSIGPDTVTADLVEATFNGYAEASPAASPIVTDDDGTRSILLDATFVAGAGLVAPGENITGYFVTYGVGDTLLGGERFDDPVPIAAVGDYLDLDAHLPMPHNAETGLPQ